MLKIWYFISYWKPTWAYYSYYSRVLRLFHTLASKAAMSRLFQFDSFFPSNIIVFLIRHLPSGSNIRNRLAASKGLQQGVVSGGGGGGFGREEAHQDTDAAAAIPTTTPRRTMVVEENLKWKFVKVQITYNTYTFKVVILFSF